MNKEELTYGQLIELDADIQKQQSASPAFIFFNAEKINRFYSLNKQRLTIAKKRLKPC